MCAFVRTIIIIVIVIISLVGRSVDATRTSSYRKIQTTINTFAHAERNSVTVDDSSSYDVLKVLSLSINYWTPFSSIPITLVCVSCVPIYPFETFSTIVDNFSLRLAREKSHTKRKETFQANSRFVWKNGRIFLVNNFAIFSLVSSMTRYRELVDNLHDFKWFSHLVKI